MKSTSIYSTGQVAGMLGLTEPQLNNHVRRGAVPRVAVGPGGRRCWTDHDIDAAREALAARTALAATSSCAPAVKGATTNAS